MSTTQRTRKHSVVRLVGPVLALAVSLSVVPAGPAAAATDPAVRGLYGTQDATYDGVYRQGLAILALKRAGAGVDRSAVQWLRRQQCGNGRFTSYRSDLTVPCGEGDSNATAMAVMALQAAGRTKAANRGLDWLVGRQLPGGGWTYAHPDIWGGGPDANSTGLVVQALLKMGVRPASVKTEGSTPFDFLSSLQIRCEGAQADRGALDYQPQDPLAPNDYATAQATQALARSALPVRLRAVSTKLPRLDCSTPDAGGSQAELAAGYLGRRLAANDGLIPSAFGPGADYGSTANAVLSLVAAGYGAKQVDSAVARLQEDVRAYAVDGSRRILPAAAAALILVARATGTNPRDFGGVNLVKRLRNSIAE